MCSIERHQLPEFGPTFRFHRLVLHGFEHWSEGVKVEMLYFAKIHQPADKFVEKVVYSDLKRTDVSLFLSVFWQLP